MNKLMMPEGGRLVESDGCAPAVWQGEHEHRLDVEREDRMRRDGCTQSEIRRAAQGAASSHQSGEDL